MDPGNGPGGIARLDDRGGRLGMFAYAAAIVLLWLAAARPAGAERVVFERLWQRFVKRGAAPASTS